MLRVFKVPDGFEPPIRELQSHALPLGYGTIYSPLRVKSEEISS